MSEEQYLSLRRLTDPAISMIRKVINAGAKLDQVYVDTVGDPAKYEAKLKAVQAAFMKIGNGNI
jgi:hypothetical protein